MVQQQRSNLEKAAAIIISLGPEKAGQVLSRLSFGEAQLLATQVARIVQPGDDERREILEGLRERAQSPIAQLTSAEGLRTMRTELAQTFGETQAGQIIEQFARHKEPPPFYILGKAEVNRIIEVLSPEHPGVIALVSSFLPCNKAAQMLAGLTETCRQQVVLQLANLQPPRKQVVDRLEELLTLRLADVIAGRKVNKDEEEGPAGHRVLVEILQQVEPAVEKRIYDFLIEQNPELAEEVRKSMFIFEDIAKMEQRALQTVLREVPGQELALALKGAPEELLDLVYNNVSENAAKMIREELELLGPVRVSQVEEARQKVVATVRRLADEGAIELRGEDNAEEMIQ